MCDILIRRISLGRKGTRLFRVRIDMDICCETIGEDESRWIVPLLWKEGYRKELPVVMLNGRRRHKGFLRIFGFFRRFSLYRDYGIYKVLEVPAGYEKNKRLRCRYDFCLPYVVWMDKASLELIVDTAGVNVVIGSWQYKCDLQLS